MNKSLRGVARAALFLLLATSFAACHFHGHHGWGHCLPVRHCR